MFFQYDMMFNDNIIEILQKNITQPPILFSLGCNSFNFCSYDTWNEPDTLKYIINDYENFYTKSFTYNNNYPFYNIHISNILFLY